MKSHVRSMYGSRKLHGKLGAITAARRRINVNEHRQGLEIPLCNNGGLRKIVDENLFCSHWEGREGSGQVRDGSMRQSSASLRPLSAGWSPLGV